MAEQARVESVWAPMAEQAGAESTWTPTAEQTGAVLAEESRLEAGTRRRRNQKTQPRRAECEEMEMQVMWAEEQRTGSRCVFSFSFGGEVDGVPGRTRVRPLTRRPPQTSTQSRLVIQYRNELMHSCEFRVKDEWIKLYRGTLKHFVQQLSQDVPHMSTVGQQIEDMLTVDLSICVFGVDRMDSAGPDSDADSQLEASAELVGQWEAELLQEMLQECLCAEDGVDSETQDTEQLRRLQAFLQANQDLREKFSSELQTITTLEVGQ
ncbi:uncharacterized protein LOC119414879 [Nematolebias whitei]|uniref:uncharacterized protein LOC119414879 n=1 Tax=Nematolebias whitei TaxID=451745 RepID=UPI00189BBAB9|nr:uncharacterized protein LOC119414879 [Nematolebias whitei]